MILVVLVYHDLAIDEVVVLQPGAHVLVEGDLRASVAGPFELGEILECRVI